MSRTMNRVMMSEIHRINVQRYNRERSSVTPHSKSSYTREGPNEVETQISQPASLMLASVAAVLFSGGEWIRRIDMNTVRNKIDVTPTFNNLFEMNTILVAGTVAPKKI